ncbi:hypothetical protein HMPREF9296_1822 [Prevotella disiens FB035-09AN]|uniref:Uncharacterized protein n=1 Tax=Prevotella disiens FB035-09AN TaxID=866771 RepID=E1KTL1_9BACT|nr:hypothetical protein HMPREF9296_1822 [Prevotella disiens FB035-09AN]
MFISLICKLYIAKIYFFTNIFILRYSIFPVTLQLIQTQ